MTAKCLLVPRDSQLLSMVPDTPRSSIATVYFTDIWVGHLLCVRHGLGSRKAVNGTEETLGSLMICTCACRREGEEVGNKTTVVER